MTFTVNDLTRCAGLNHYRLTVTVDGVTRVITTSLQEVQLDLATFDEAKEAVVARCRSAAKEANAANWTQIKNALIGSTFKL